MSGMYGKYTHSVDAKGRLFVPSKLRDKLGERFYVMIGLENSLLVYPEERWEDTAPPLTASSSATSAGSALCLPTSANASRTSRADS